MNNKPIERRKTPRSISLEDLGLPPDWGISKQGNPKLKTTELPMSRMSRLANYLYGHTKQAKQDKQS